MGQISGKSACALSAGYEAGSCKKTGDTPETQEELKEKLLYKHQAGESSISDKMMTADDTLSEKGSLMSKFVFSHQASTCYSTGALSTTATLTVRLWREELYAQQSTVTQT